ncbi:rCG41920 [Rattus norvegicus]|uniref:RCG41920 n=1 Tax=Rattus norvegicus TaxID=10116 RepID=A6KKV0_RAT|nr:rCG41920 [Rattus norvegicus]
MRPPTTQDTEYSAPSPDILRLGD